MFAEHAAPQKQDKVERVAKSSGELSKKVQFYFIGL